MKYYTEKDDNRNISTVQAVFNDVFCDIGYIEKPYNNLEMYFATGYNHKSLTDNGNYYFQSFDEAESKIIKQYEMEVLSR